MNLHNEQRGFRNNNPGNIRHGNNWLGLDQNQSDSDFCKFVSIEYGIRAIFKIINTYKTKYNLNKIKSIIYKWAPPNENDTERYVQAVVEYMNLKNGHDEIMGIEKYTQESVINEKNSCRFVQALIQYECGKCPFNMDFIKTCHDFNY